MSWLAAAGDLSPSTQPDRSLAEAQASAYIRFALSIVEVRERPPSGAWFTGTGFGRVACRIKYPKGE
jgi:hypothetical protein